MKKCFKCNDIKPIDEYYKHPQMKDGHLNKCKDCARHDAKVGTVPRTCTECGKNFMAVYTEVVRRSGGAYTCSRDCYYERLRKILAEKFAVKSSYSAIHQWVYKNNGKANSCELCETTESKAYHWSNKSGEYKQDLDDWWQLCVKCHNAYDKIPEKMWATRKERYVDGFKNSKELSKNFRGKVL